MQINKNNKLFRILLDEIFFELLNETNIYIQ